MKGVRSTKIENAIGDARRRINERTAKAVNKYTRNSNIIHSTYNKCRKTEPSIQTEPSQQEVRRQFNDRATRAQQEARRQLNDRAKRALDEYTRCFKAAQAQIIPVQLDDFRDAHSFSSNTERYYLGSLNEDTEHETVSEMQSSWFDARESLSAHPRTQTIETQTDLSFVSF